MAKMVLKAAYLNLNSVDLSDHVESITINYEGKEVDATTMGDAAEWALPGLKNWSIDIDWAQDYAAGKVDATIWPLVGGATFAVEARPSTAVVSATNPKWTGTGRIFKYNPIAGSVGQLAKAKTTVAPGDGTDLVRATA